jgi:large repetitive protein
VLTSTLYDVQPTEISLVKSSNTIQATNQIFNTSFVGYEAQNAILLLPGFETKLSTDGYFRAEIKTCN